MAYTDDWESLMNGVFGPGGRFKAAPGTSAPKTGGSAALPDLNAALLEQQKRLDELLKQQNAQLRTQSDATAAALESSRWWELDRHELADRIGELDAMLQNPENPE